LVEQLKEKNFEIAILKPQLNLALSDLRDYKIKCEKLEEKSLEQDNEIRSARQ